MYAMLLCAMSAMLRYAMSAMLRYAMSAMLCYARSAMLLFAMNLATNSCKQGSINVSILSYKYSLCYLSL